MRWWEVLMASRGYNQRGILTHQMLRLTAYSAFYAFRDNKDGKEPQQWMPLWFDDVDEAEEMNDDDVDELMGLMHEINSKNESK